MCYNKKIDFLHNRYATWIFIIVAATCFVLFFIGGPNSLSLRSYKCGWDLGHLFAFFVWVSLFIRFNKRFNRLTFLKQFIVVIVASSIIGASIEIVQVYFNRTPSFDDLLRDVVGSILALIWFSPSIKLASRKYHLIIRPCFLILIVVSVIPFSSAVVSDVINRVQFPVLADFETPFELGRWAFTGKLTNGSILSKSSEIARHGKYSMKMALTTKRYSGAYLTHFPADWHEFSFIQFSIFNSSEKSIKISCKIHDSMHIRNGYLFNDRFNTRIILTKGWNDISIPLSKIINAPINRQMDISDIIKFQLFVGKLQKPVVVYVDYIRLVK